MAEPVRCGEPGCETVLREPENVAVVAREPCPRCGSRKRLYARLFAGSVTATGTLATAVATGAAAVYAAAKILVRPPVPEPGYHLQHDHHDVLGGAIVFGIAAAAAVVTARELGRAWRERFVRGSRTGSSSV